MAPAEWEECGGSEGTAEPGSYPSRIPGIKGHRGNVLSPFKVLTKGFLRSSVIRTRGELTDGLPGQA